MRLAPDGVLAIEVWDLPIAGKLLQEWRDHPAFPTHLAAVVHQLRADPPAAFTPAAHDAARAIDHVHLLGGGVTEDVAVALAIPSTRSADPFAAARAGAALYPDALCADVGQAAIKLAHGERTRRVDRDLTAAPMRDATPLGDRARARESTLAFLASTLASGASRIVLGLPCEIDADDRPRSCTYCWPDPDPSLITELEHRTGLPIDYLNDAELAALAAAPVVPPTATTLVLTIGFSVGGALITTHR